MKRAFLKKGRLFSLFKAKSFPNKQKKLDYLFFLLYLNIAFKQMCGHGGIGRRVTLRSLWAKPVEVQVFLAAPVFLLIFFYVVFMTGRGRC